MQAAADNASPVIAYDRLIEDPNAFYITFDNVEVGRMQAREVLAVAPEGNYVMIKGSNTDPNSDFLRGGQQKCCGGDRFGRGSPSLAKPTPTAGCPRTRSAT